MDDQEVELVRTSIRGVLAEADAGPLPERLRALGWDDLRIEDPAVAVGTLFEEHGRALAVSRALDAVVADALGIEIDAETAVVHPGVSTVDQPPSAAGRLEGLVLGPLAPGTRLVAVEDDGSPKGTRFVSSAPGDDFVARALEGFDPSLGLVSVSGALTRSGRAANGAWTAAVDVARRALAHELIGVAEAALALAVEHVTGREQFGHPIAAFQTVRHRLADDFVAITAARSTVAAAWHEPGNIPCSAAKALAGRAALLATRDAQQVCGAIGFTWEHRLHRYLRRAWALDSLYGTAAEMERRIGARLIEAGEVPRVLPLGVG